MFDDIDLLSATPAELLGSVVDLEPGPWVMSILLTVDRSALAPEDALTYLKVHESVSSWWASLQTAAWVAAARPEPYVDEYRVLVPDSDEERTFRIQDAIREEAACALRLAPATAQARIDTARLLAEALAATQESLSLGEISPAHVRVIVEAAGRLPGAGADAATDPQARARFLACCERLQERVLPVARRSTVGCTRRAADRAVIAIDADGARRRRDRARCTRDVVVIDEADGLSVLLARMATPLAHAALSMVQAVADDTVNDTAPDTASDGRTAGERRADALTELILGDPGTATQPTAAGRVTAQIDVVVPLTTLLGLSAEPGILNGRTIVAGEEVRALLTDPDIQAVLHRLVTDPVDGAPLDYGRRTYAVPRRLRRVLEIRDRTCRMPGCSRRARHCQIDHARSWHDGGRTCPCNTGPLCVRHHLQKTHGGWDLIRSLPSGECEWRSPHGHTYRHLPEPFTDPDPPPF